MYDNNRSKDVPGPLLKRPYDTELPMKEESKEGNLSISSMPLSSLHEGNVEKPLAALGSQEVKVSMPMGSDSKASAPKISK